MGDLRTIVADLCDSCSRNPVLKVGLSRRFDEADNGIKNKQTISTTPAPDVGRPFNM